MAHADFVHLRVHSAYSLSEGAIKIKELVALCRRYGMPAVAITDTGNLFGALEFSMAAAEAGIQPIIGCHLAVSREDERSAAGAPPPPDRLVLLVQDETGYRNLLKLVSRSFLESENGTEAQVPLSDLADRSAGLIALTGGVAGPVGRLLADGQDAAADSMLARLAEMFPGRLYVELERHGLEVEDRIEGALVELAYAHGLPLVATNEAFFADESMYEAHDALLCIAEGTYVAEQDRRRLTPEHRFRTPAEMRTLFADLPEAVDNTLVIARRCAYMPEPRAPMLPDYPTADGRDVEDELRRQAREGLEARLAAHVFTPDMDAARREQVAHGYFQRLDYELGVIAEMGFAGYFLIVADFIQWAKRQGIPVGPGRGSGAGSVVAWALTITDLDPLRWGLLFERFLNPERVSMPDFDVDFCQERRDEVIRYVQDKYGHDRVAQIITFGTFQPRAALRDVGRVLQLPYPLVDRICKLVPNNPANPVTLAQALESEPMLREMQANDEAVARMIDIAQKLEGLYRHASTHAAGVVIGDRPLDEIIPLYRDVRSDTPVTQFSMKYVEQAGLVKFDFLGLKTLTVLAEARDLLKARGVDIDYAALPLDDRPTYEMLGRGEAVGVFQLESSGMRDVLRRLRPDRFEDIIAVVALYRPGPMENIPRYINCKHGIEKPDYFHPSLKGILEETFGIMIYQEQVMQIAQELAGYSLGGADLLRRAMGKKIRSEMEAQRRTFVEGAEARGVERATAVQIFEQVAKFAGYGFNKSHAAAYALVAYQTAYMKANHPVEFLAASMTHDMRNTDKLNVFRQELQRLGIPLLPPDVNRSRDTFSVEVDETGRPAIRYALAAIKNVGQEAMRALVKEREAGGPFADLRDLARRLDSRVLNKRQLEGLASAGALDCLNPNRRQTFEGIEALVRAANAAAQERESTQASLFDEGEQGIDLPLPDVDDWPPLERLQHEFAAIGFYLSAHPLDSYAKALSRLGVVTAAEVVSGGPGGPTRVKLAGTAIAKQERTSAKGNRYAFVTLSDTGGIYEVTVFSEVLAEAREIIDSGAPLLITADVRFEEEQVRFTAHGIQSLDQAAEQAAAGIRVFLADASPLDPLREVIEREKRGRGRISLVLPLDGTREAEISLPGRYRVHPPLQAAIKKIPGVVDVQEV